jgi:hypothetical protein
MNHFAMMDRFGSNCVSNVAQPMVSKLGLEQNFPCLVDPKEAVIEAMIQYTLHTEDPLL